MSKRYRVYTIDVESLRQFGEIFEPTDYKSWVTFVSDRELKEVEQIYGVVHVIPIS